MRTSGVSGSKEKEVVESAAVPYSALLPLFQR